MNESVETCMALLGAEATLQRLARAHAGEHLERDLAASRHLLLTGDRVRWKPGYLHQAAQKLTHQQIATYMREQGGVSGSEAANILRLSVYHNRQTQLFPAAYRLCPPGWAAAYFFPPDERFLAEREVTMRALVLEDLAPTLWATGEWSPVLQRLASQTSLLEEVSTGLALARGDSVYDLPTHLRGRGYRALQLFLQGDGPAACAEWQRRVARRKAGAPALPGLVAVLARVAALRGNHLASFLDARFSAPAFPWAERFLNTLARHLQTPMSGDEFAERARLDKCGAGLDALVWRAARARLPALPAEPPKPVDNGLHALSVALSDEAEEPPWKSWLEGLRQEARKRPERAVAETTGHLSWRLWTDGVVIYRHRDEEDGGRPVDAARLARKPPDFLSLQDRLVLAKMDGARLTAEAVRALSGHPHLYFEASPCELVERPQKMRLDRTPEGLSLKLEPEIKGDRQFRLRRLNERQVALTVATPWNDTLQPLLALRQAVPAEGESELREILASWPGEMEIECGAGVLPVLPTVVRPNRVVLRVMTVQSGLRLEWMARDDILAFPALRGPEHETVRWHGQDCQVKRDFAQEESWLVEVWDRCPWLPRETELMLSDLDSSLDFLQRLKDAVVPLEWSQSKEWKVQATATPASLSLRALRGEGEWFEVGGSLRLDDTRVLALSRALELAREYPGRYLPLQEGDFVRLDQRLREQLELLARLLEPHGKTLRLSALAVPALDAITIDALHGDSHYREMLGRFREAESLVSSVPRTVQAELRDYQVEGYRWLAQRASLGAGACLADDMGLGKTLQALTLMVKEQVNGPHLVVCPTSVSRHWLEQTRQFCPTLRPLLYEGRDRRPLLASLQAGQVVLTSYRLLLQDQRFFAAVDWNVALLDEAQTIKNPHSKTARACFKLKARVRLATTGTPIENRLSELWSLFRFLNPGLLGSLASFQQRFEQTFERENRPYLRRMVAPFLLRRLKSEVLKELPERTELTLTVELSKDERALYESVRRRAAEQLEKGDTLELLAHLTRLRQACCHPRLLVPDSLTPSAKMVAFFELLDHLRAGGHRALVFSQFTSLLDLVEEGLQAQQVPYLRLDGSTPPPVRQARVSAFQNGQGDLFLISLKAGGTGLNLTAADYVVHLDPWWNPAAEDQATDRAHRIGQTRPVTVYRLLARDTIEEKVLRLHGHKRELARDILGGRQEGTVPLGWDELRALVQR